MIQEKLDKVKQLRKKANKLEKEGREKIDQYINDNFFSLLDETKFLGDCNRRGGGFQLVVKEGALKTLFKQRQSEYPGVTISINEDTFWLHELGGELVLRVGPFPDTNSDVCRFAKVRVKHLDLSRIRDTLKRRKNELGHRVRYIENIENILKYFGNIEVQ